MHHAKSLFDELAAAGWPLSLKDFNLNIFRGLRSEFKDLVTSLVTKAEPLSYANLHSHLFTHEFLHKSSLPVMTANPPLLPTPSLLPSAHLAQHQHQSDFSCNRGRSCGYWRPNNSQYNSHHKSNFHVVHSPAPADWKQNNWQQTRRSAGSGQWPFHRSFE
jgi:hypothetical protein